MKLRKLRNSYTLGLKFNVINDLERYLRNEVVKVADDPRLLRLTRTRGDFNKLRRSLSKVSEQKAQRQTNFSIAESCALAGNI